MNTSERRKKLENIMRESSEPIKGGELSDILDVSRQVIVQDIALLRAQGLQIVATPQGYILYDNKNTKSTITIACNHHMGIEEIYDELKLIVDLGGRVIDVIIEHGVYGQIKANLNIKSRRDIDIFIDKIKTTEGSQLSSLTNGAHSHTIEADNEEILKDILKKLEKNNILIK